MAAVTDAAMRDARALAAGGMDSLLVENYGDTPFFPGAVPPETIAGLTAAVLGVRSATPLPVGVNVLRNDAAAAVAIAAVTGATFVRVNIHTGGMFTDQGWIEGRAAETVRARERLAPDVAILADVLVKHAVPPADTDAVHAADDAWERGHADALIVSGHATGRPADLEGVAGIRASIPGATILVGSGVTPDTIRQVLAVADGAIIGSSLRADGRAGNPVEPDRVRRLVEAAAG